MAQIENDTTYMNNPTTSALILLSTYNGEKYLENQIQSLLNQTIQNFRLLICDDQSTDGTQQIIDTFIKQFPDKIFQVF